MAEKFVDKIKFFMGFESYDEDEYEEELEEDDYSSNQPTASSLYSSSQKNTTVSAPKTQNVSSAVKSGTKIVNFNKTQSSNLKVMLYQPKDFNDSKTVVDNLKVNKPVILNIENLDTELARKIFDFCSGALYALDGHIQQISRGIFILAPPNVDVSGDVKGELKSKGIFSFTNKE
ncbi:cell division protein SepF [Helicovermis profundi]|uniref:Cell division protein SepF n=1 Tax=Helicovermis profundi TaxID=3065157 RepID=A0AAU9ESQ7_9FIRM|nr:hypothetical protein HLPR_18160 [Clostridia bacterium S502]